MSTKIESSPLPQINVNKSITELPPITDPTSHSDEKSRRRAHNKKQYKRVNRTYKCAHCSFARSHASIVREHMLRAHTEHRVEQGGSGMKYKCNRCSVFPNYFSTFKDLCSHLREAHKSEDTDMNTASEETVVHSDFKCKYCDKELKTKAGLLSHERHHTHTWGRSFRNTETQSERAYRRSANLPPIV